MQEIFKRNTNDTLGHNGLHFGKQALWDPRTDMMMFDIDNIIKNKIEWLIPNTSVIIAHEFSHRTFYQSRSVLDIASISHFFNNHVFNSKRISSDDKKFVQSIGHNLTRAQHLLTELDPLFDAYFALVFYNDLRTKIADEDEFYNALAQNLIDANSRKFFDAFMWLYRSFQKKVSERQTIIPQFVLFRALDVGVNPFKSTSMNLIELHPQRFSILFLILLREYMNQMKKY